MATPDVRTTLGELALLPWQLTRSALLVPRLVARTASILDDISAIVGAVDDLLSATRTTLTRIQHTADAAAALPTRVAHVIEQSEALPGRAVMVIDRGMGVFDGAGTLIGELDALDRLRPLIDALAELDPGVATQLGRLIPSIGPLLTRLEDEVIPSVGALQTLVPVVELLHRNVSELQTVVTEVGKLLGSVPGAGILRRRADRDGMGD
jgi:ABC-type transporter Mla subunit MlaD